MKKKSLFGFSANLALMLVAICGMFASCYEKEELTVEKPSTTAPVYKITGVVYDETTGAALSGVSVNGATTDASGAYSLSSENDKVKAGLNVLSFSKDKYKTVTTSIYVDAIENGQVAVYKADAALCPGVTYKTVQYDLAGAVIDNENAAVALREVQINGLTPVVSGNTFSANNVKPGFYYATLIADGYNNTYANINIAQVTAEKGEPTEIQKAITDLRFIMQKKQEEKETAYYVCGFVTNSKGINISNANINVEIDGKEILAGKTNNRGYFSTKVDTEAVTITPTSLVTVTASLSGYIAQAKSCIVKLVETGAISVTSITLVLEAEGTYVPDVDPSEGGESSFTELPEPEIKKGDDIIKDEEEPVVDQIKEIAKELGHDDITDVEIPVVTVEKVEPIHLTSTEAVTNENTGETTQETKKVTDVIELQPGTKIYYVGGVKEDIKIKRDIDAEKTVAAARVYEGQPTGAVFSKPMTIKFDVPVVTTAAEPDYAFNVLYQNEKTGEWKAEAGKYAEYNKAEGQFLAEISHFSKFRFGFESQVEFKDSLKLDAEIIDKPCYTGSASAVVTLRGQYLGGIAYDGNTPSLAVKAALGGMSTEIQSYVTVLFYNMIKKDYANVLPKNAYEKTAVSQDIVVPANKQINNFSMVRKQIRKSYTITVLDKNKAPKVVTVVVKRISGAEIAPNYAVGHTHGHGDGTDLNAGGGIMDFE